MTKGELLRFLEPFNDDIPIQIDNDQLKIMDIRYVHPPNEGGLIILDTYLENPQ